LGVCVASLVGNQGKHVGFAVPTTQAWKTPVHRHGGDGRVMIVECVVRGAFQVFGNGATKEDGEDFVTGGVSLDFVKRQEDERVVHEVGIVEERYHKVTLPRRSECDVRIVSVIGHVWSDERPLR